MTDVIDGSKAARDLIDHTEEAIDGSLLLKMKWPTQVAPTCLYGMQGLGGWGGGATGHVQHAECGFPDPLT